MPVLPGAEPYASDGGRIGALVLHGLTSTTQSVRPWAEHLAAAGLTVRAPLLPGHGTRWEDLAATTWHEWYAAAERGLLALRERCDSVTVMGQSMGGTLAIRLAEERHDAVDGLVLVNPSLFTEDRRGRFLPVLKRVVRSVPAIANDVKHPGEPELAYTRTPVRAVASLDELWRLTRRDLARVDQPLLLFRSAEDHVVEASNSVALLAGIASTDVEERVLTDSYHVATLDADAPAIFAGSAEHARRVHARGEAGYKRA